MVENSSLDHVSAGRAGAAGGGVAALNQFYSTTFDDFCAHLFEGENFLAMKLFGIFLMAAAILMLCGFIVAHFLQTKTQNRWALFVAGLMATSIGSTALPEIKSFIKRSDLSLISVAHAASSDCAEANITILSGLGEFFGLSDGYRVVVGSFKRAPDAQALVARINSEQPSLGAYVGQRAPCNEYYPVIVGPNHKSQSGARQTLNQVLKLDFIPGAYISNRKW